MPTSESSSSSSSDDADTALGMEFLPLELMLHAMEASLRKKSSKSKNKKRKSKRKHREETPGTGDEAGEAGPGLKPAAPRGPKRKRKRSAGASSVIESVADAAELIRNAKRIVVLCGAGISVSCGIPDFRSANGLYATLASLGLPVAEPEVCKPVPWCSRVVLRQRCLLPAGSHGHQHIRGNPRAILLFR